MSDETFADLFQAKTVIRPTMQPGDRVEAVVVSISGDNIFLDIGGKSEGVLDATELRNEAGELTVAPGDSLKVYFLGARSGETLFTTRLGSGRASSLALEEACRTGIPIEGKVTGEIKGGFAVTVAGQQVFCPYSQMDIRKVDDAEEYIDKTFAFKVIEFSNQGKNVIVSSRAVLEEQRAQAREQLKERLTEGMQVSGTVTSLRDFGAFVDIGGVDGLIPISEIAWGQIDRVDDVLSNGQQVHVVIKQLDWDKDRISLSLRETLENPWDKAGEKYLPASIHQGRVSRLTTFGAFVTLEPGVDGLLHISKLGAGRKIHHPREVLETGQDLTVKIESVDTDQKRISLAPEDYTAPEGQRQDERPITPAMSKEPVSMGTLGDLLKAQMKKK